MTYQIWIDQYKVASANEIQAEIMDALCDENLTNYMIAMTIKDDNGDYILPDLNFAFTGSSNDFSAWDMILAIDDPFYLAIAYHRGVRAPVIALASCHQSKEVEKYLDLNSYAKSINTFAGEYIDDFWLDFDDIMMIQGGEHSHQLLTHAQRYAYDSATSIFDQLIWTLVIPSIKDHFDKTTKTSKSADSKWRNTCSDMTGMELYEYGIKQGLATTAWTDAYKEFHRKQRDKVSPIKYTSSGIGVVG